MNVDTITILCRGTAEAPHDVYIVDQYRRHLVGDRGAWLPLEHWAYQGATGRSAGATQRYLIGNKPARHAAPDDEAFRMQFALRCPRCNFRDKRDLKRGNDVIAALFDTFDRMTAAGADEIPVRLLAELVRRPDA